MIRFILVTFLFLGWAFYELSGGSAFVPEEPMMAEADDAVDTAAAEVVTRSVDPTLGALAVPTRLTEPLIAAPAEVPAVPDTAVEAILEEVAAPSPDLREVAGSRVNMRTGPGTDYGVVTTLDSGTRAEVIETDPSGWVKLRVVSSGVEGWMAARLLTSVEG